MVMVMVIVIDGDGDRNGDGRVNQDDGIQYYYFDTPPGDCD